MINPRSEGNNTSPNRLLRKHPLNIDDQSKLAESRAKFEAKCQAIFEKLKPVLSEDYYNWFMVIEPESEDYFIDADEIEAERKAREKHPEADCLILCINETGACGRA
ncbi:hypothetical protein [Laspinema olomoucense]|uniref:Uncharacterized protein n=1 Tax=Laspinema olomoucense D3b TaxID=2953688 RepID=A0ABT2NHB6_9CYAN|nr:MULTISPECIES: hypothetical protein [unclassified Laspinema]MCT7975365.1 hypothetical protein [Laspinema sp. D3d]MCT7980735.1 hypothetical protein [Laspinema sp. D3b]MCT7988596.1 hypothetical protein [Laspinema sp. D3a]